MAVPRSSSSKRDDVWNATFPWLVEGTKAFRNDPTSRFGFGVVDGRQIPSQFVEEFTVADHCCTVSVMTDGYPVPCQTLEEAEAELAALIRRDPQMAGATKGVMSGDRSFDDRAFVRLEMLDHPRR